jgi:hypothetical protein
MNVASFTVNITSLSLTVTSNNPPPPSVPASTVEADAGRDRVSLSSLLSNLQNVSANVAQQGAHNGTLSLNALKHDFQQAFNTYASNGRPIQGHPSPLSWPSSRRHASGHATSLDSSHVQQALDQLTTPLQQQVDSNGTVSKDIVRQDVRQLFSSLRGQSAPLTSTLQTVV